MLKKLSKKDGFTIMEAVISIFALSVISIFVIKMFFLAEQVNVTAKENDWGLFLATNAIEVIKSKNNPDEIFSDSYFTEAAVIKEKGQTKLYICYDKSFATITASAYQVENSNELFEMIPEAYYILDISISHQNRPGWDFTSKMPMETELHSEPEYLHTGLYQILATITKREEPTPNNYLSLQTNKYFVYIDA